MSIEVNDLRLNKSRAQLKVLLDGNIYILFQEMSVATEIHCLELLDQIKSVDYYFTSSVCNELMQGREGINPNTTRMLLHHSLRDEGTGGEKENRFLYTDKAGNTRFATLNTVSGVDYGQILICQNHKDLVLVTNDHSMLKSAAALLDQRLMDLEHFFKIIAEHPMDEKTRREWFKIAAYYSDNSGYKRPKTVRQILDRG